MGRETKKGKGADRNGVQISTTVRWRAGPPNCGDSRAVQGGEAKEKAKEGSMNNERKRAARHVEDLDPDLTLPSVAASLWQGAPSLNVLKCLEKWTAWAGLVWPGPAWF